AREQAEYAPAASAARVEPPLAEDPFAVPGAQGEFPQLGEGAVGQDEVPPVHGGADAAGVAFQARGRLPAGGEPDVVGGDRAAVEGGEGAGPLRGAPHPVPAEPVGGDG